MGGKNSSAVRYPWLDPPFIGKSTSYPPCPCAGLVALRQSFVRRCHGGLGSPGQPEIDKSSMMAGKSARRGTGPWPDAPYSMRLSFQSLREALAGIFISLPSVLLNPETQFYIDVSLASDE